MSLQILMYNLVAIGLLILAGLIIWLDRDGWGWCVFGAIITSVVPRSKDDDDE